MKRLCAAAIACLLLLSVLSCARTPSTAESAKALIEAGKLTEAYALLHAADKNDAEAKALFACFKSLPTTQTTARYTMYNGICEKTYNKYGDVTKEICTETYNDFPHNYVIQSEYTYDADGRILTCVSTETGYSNYEKTFEYTYDANGNLAKEYERRTYTGQDSSYEMLTEYKYDSDGNMSESIVYENNEPRYRYEYSHSGGKMTVRTYFTREPDGTESATADRYTRNEHGDIVKTTTVQPNGTETETTYEYTYDSSGRIALQISRLSVGEDRREFVYNEQGDILKQTVIDCFGDRVVTENEITYDEDGIKSFEVATTNAFTLNNSSSEYDEYGNIVRYTTDSGETVYEYTYGNPGQILTKTELKKDGVRLYSEYSYNPDGTNAKTAGYRLDEDGKAREPETELIYDGKGNLISESKIGFQITENTYDEYNNIISARTSDASGKITAEKSYRYIYDTKGNITEKTEVTERGSTRYIYTYNPDGLVTSSSIYNNDGVLYYGSEYIYDDKGNMTDHRASFYRDGIKDEEYFMTYTYDKCGNRLTETGTMEAGSEKISVRTYSDFVCFYIPAE